jgi:hypothetical protein
MGQFGWRCTSCSPCMHLHLPSPQRAPHQLLVMTHTSVMWRLATALCVLLAALPALGMKLLQVVHVPRGAAVDSVPVPGTLVFRLPNYDTDLAAPSLQARVGDCDVTLTCLGLGASVDPVAFFVNFNGFLFGGPSGVVPATSTYKLVVTGGSVRFISYHVGIGSSGSWAGATFTASGRFGENVDNRLGPSGDYDFAKTTPVLTPDDPEFRLTASSMPAAGGGYAPFAQIESFQVECTASSA